MFQVNQREGRRWSAADAFLRPALKRPNLEVITRTRVLRAEFEGDRTVGVRIASGRGHERSIRAEREVILSAGSVQSLQLLLLSGIGSADDLRAVGVDVRHDLPGVGRNLQDHPFVTLIWEVSDQNTRYGADKPKPLAEWVLRRTGPLTSSVAEVVAFVRTRAGLPGARWGGQLGPQDSRVRFAWG
jgi:choline dehydrogenase